MSQSISYVVKLTSNDSQDAPFVAYSPEFDIASAGKTKPEARKNLAEAVSIVLQGAKEDGNFDQILEDAGYEKINGDFQPRVVEVEEDKISV